MSDFLSKLTGSWPLSRWSDVTVLAAVSGGADSVALLCGLAQLRSAGAGNLVAAHFNHRLRGADSDADQAFVEALAGQLGIELVIGAASTDLARGHRGEGLEGVARHARYEFLASSADRCGARYVATAHTADDQVETILHHILRGTGLAGLAGIPRARPLTSAATLIRPLLEVTRGDVLDYLQLLGQAYREDLTNQLLDLTRNRIRHELLPLMERHYNPHSRSALTRLGTLAGEADAWLRQQSAELAREIGQRIPGGIELRMQPLCAVPALVARYVLIGLWREQGWPMQDMSFEKWEQLLTLACAPQLSAPTVQTFPGDIRAENQGGILRLTRPG